MSSVIKKEDKDNHSYKVTIRVYGKDDSRDESHSYLIDDICTGVSSPIGQLSINIRTVTLTQVRPMLEYDRSKNMNKRSLLFQEALFIMSRLPNHYSRPHNDMKIYRFGFVKKDKSTLRLIKRSDEDKPIADLIGAVDFFEHDLCIVPLSQLPPDET
jgi:hypothetical protein